MKCTKCKEETGSHYYKYKEWTFCKNCRETWILFIKGQHMAEFEVDKEVYLRWYEDKTKAVADLSSDEIEERIKAVWHIKFYASEEWAILHRQYDQINGRNSIPKWMKEDRARLITEPNIKVDLNGEPRKKEPKEKKPKQNLLKDLLDIDLKELEAAAHHRSIDKDKEKKEDKEISIDDAIGQLIVNAQAAKVIPPEVTDEEKERKAAALKEKLRLLREAKEKTQG